MEASGVEVLGVEEKVVVLGNDVNMVILWRICICKLMLDSCC